MDKETFLNKLKEIGTIEDEVQRRDLISDLTDEVSSVYDQYNNLVEEDKKHVEDIEKLREANMKLFLKVGTEKTEEQREKDLSGSEPEKEPRKFEDLFDDKGNLK